MFGSQKQPIWDFLFFRLILRVKNELKMAKKSKFSIFDKSADSADFDDPQIRKCVYGSF